MLSKIERSKLQTVILINSMIQPDITDEATAMEVLKTVREFYRNDGRIFKVIRRAK